MVHFARNPHPDYLSRFPTGNEVLVEAVVARDEAASASAAQARQKKLFDEINKIASPNFFLQILTYEDITGRQPSGRRVRSFLEREIGGVDPDEATDTYEISGVDALPLLSYEDRDVRITFRLIPKSPEGRERDSRPIGVYPMMSRWGGATESIRNAINRKATRYGELAHPFVVAVNCTSPWGFDIDDVVEALFGRETLVFSDLANDPVPRRAPDGVWYGPDGSQNTRVSAVLYAELVPWGLHNSSIRLFLNPWAKLPLDPGDWTLPLAIPKDGHLVWEDGPTTSELYGLPVDWPGEKWDRAAT